MTWWAAPVPTADPPRRGRTTDATTAGPVPGLAG